MPLNDYQLFVMEQEQKKVARLFRWGTPLITSIFAASALALIVGTGKIAKDEYAAVHK